MDDLARFSQWNALVKDSGRLFRRWILAPWATAGDVRELGPGEPPDLPEVVEARRERRLACGFAVAGILVFTVAAFLDPFDDQGRPRTHGTHQQLGLPACTLKSLTGVGCPSCGMTTTFALLMHGELVAAWHTNWAGCIVALLAAGATVWFTLVAAGLPTGRFTADEVVRVAALGGVAVAVLRWVAGLVMAAFQAP